MGRKAVFFDRDGTLIVEKPYQCMVEQMEIYPDAVDAVRRLHMLGYLVVIVTNQSGVARKLFAVDELQVFNAELMRRLEMVEKVYYCPHHPLDYCRCRKPQSGMLLEAQRDYDIDLSQSWMVGDSSVDVIAGRMVGCKTILIKRGGMSVNADYVVDTLSNIGDIINS